MRIGCIGCLLLIIAVVVALVGVGGVFFLSANIYGEPDFLPVQFSRGDGFAAQHKLYEIALRQAGRSARQDPIVFSEREINAFLSRHLAQAAGLPLDPIAARLMRGQVSIQGRTPLRSLLQGPPFAQVLPYIPDERLDRPVWVTLRGRIQVESGLAGSSTRHGKVEITGFTLGKQPISAFLFYVMMGPAGASLLRWQVPTVVDSIEVEDQRVLVRTR